jgi:hypothetical protein
VGGAWKPHQNTADLQWLGDSSAPKKALRDPQRPFKLKKQPDGSWQLTEIGQANKINKTD